MATRKGLSFKVGICRAQLPPGRLTFIKKYDIISKKGYFFLFARPFT